MSEAGSKKNFKRDETLVHQDSQTGKEAAVLLRRSLSAVLVAAAVLSISGSGFAGWFSKKNDCCEECPPEPKEKKHCCCKLLPAPPRAATAIAVPAVVTAQRADRLPAKAAPAAAPAAPAACGDASAPMRDPRVDQLHNEVQIIKEQLRVLTTLLQENQ